MSTLSPAEIHYQLAHSSDSKVPRVIAANVICLSLSWIAVTLRIISRRLNHNQLKADDWFAILALCFNTGGITNNFLALRYGLARHTVLLQHPTTFSKLLLAGEAIYTPCLVTFKFSILCLYYRLFPEKKFRLTLWSIGTFILAYSIALLLSTVLECIPLRAAFVPNVKGRCIDLTTVFTVCGIFNAITDIVMLGLPLPQIWKLHVKIGRKVQLAGLFLLGGFVCVVSIIRIPQVRSVSLTDPAWSDVSGSIWSIVETNIGLVSACLPTLRPLYSYLFHGRVNDSLAPTALTDSRNWRTKDAHGGNLKRYGLQPASSSHQPFAHLESGHDTEYSEPTTMIDDGNK